MSEADVRSIFQCLIIRLITITCQNTQMNFCILFQVLRTGFMQLYSRVEGPSVADRHFALSYLACAVEVMCVIYASTVNAI